jgi:hypothetical protein
MILNFEKEINVIMCIIEFLKKKLESFHLNKNLNKIWIFKVYIFVIFKMKYFLNWM